MDRRGTQTVALVVLAVGLTLALDRLATGQAEPAAQPGDAYRVERIDVNSPPEVMATQLNPMHKDGWELADANGNLWVYGKKDVLGGPLRPR